MVVHRLNCPRCGLGSTVETKPRYEVSDSAMVSASGFRLLRLLFKP
jgi:hypothetical protein